MNARSTVLLVCGEHSKAFSRQIYARVVAWVMFALAVAAALLLLLAAVLVAFCAGRRDRRPRFLSRRQAQAVFRSSGVRRMISRMTYRECVARSSGRVAGPARFRARMLDAYVAGLDEFSAGETRMLRRLTRSEPVFASLDVCFIKMGPGFDWGLPYTVEGCIVLPPGFCGRRDARSTLAHEAVHILQRQHQREFDAFYRRSWGFVKAVRVHLPHEVASRTVVNPDSPYAVWLYKVPNGTLYWLSMEVRDDGQLVNWAYVARPDGAGGAFRVPSAGARVPLATLAGVFQGVTAATSPNELFAYLYPQGRVKLEDVLPGPFTATSRG